MRIAELSRRTGVPVPTIKYYLREGVLPPGERTSPNQARYDDTHIHRLRLVRAMVEVGGMPLATVREILDQVDADDVQSDIDKLLGTVQRAVFSTVQPHADAERQTAKEAEIVDYLRNELGWHLPLNNPAIAALASVVVTAEDLGHARFVEFIYRYAPIIGEIGVVDLDYVATAQDLDFMLESVVVGTTLGDTAILALRRMAQTNESARRFPNIRHRTFD
ncbi:MerR family transcriptional regulator [Actinokineospora enzanensis]|uniref:MerR family transcriptional regulator n=1 Tax=Actinokineospora enzanensis TaxID=155975 RepID=UPI000373B246|nr:MerR family transcriptional regulator [Actinokineospora enzanensis]